MKSAKEMWSITEETTNERIAQSKNKALAALDEVIAPQIEAAARDGDYVINYHVDASVDIDVIIAALIEAGYDVRKTGRTLRIWWLFKK